MIWNKFWFLLGISGFIIALIGCIFSLILPHEKGITTIKQVDCYDEYENKIIGVTCEEKIKTPSKEENLITYFLIGCLLVCFISYVGFKITEEDNL